MVGTEAGGRSAPGDAGRASVWQRACHGHPPPCNPSLRTWTASHPDPRPREHRLTMLLQEALAPGCHATMIAHVSAAPARHAETLSTAQLAARIHRLRRKKVKVGSLAACPPPHTHTRGLGPCPARASAPHPGGPETPRVCPGVTGPEEGGLAGVGGQPGAPWVKGRRLRGTWVWARLRGVGQGLWAGLGLCLEPRSPALGRTRRVAADPSREGCV